MLKILKKYLNIFADHETSVPTKNILLLMPAYYFLILFFASLPTYVDYEIIKTYAFIPMFLSGIFLLVLVVSLPLNIAKNKGLLTTEKQLSRWYIYLFLAYPIALVHTIIVSKKND